MARSLLDKIDGLFAEWSKDVIPTGPLRELLGDKENCRAFFHGLRRQVRSIRKRSQRSDDGEITVYDAALVRLYEHGHTMQDYGLLDFYMAEFLGTKNCKSDGEVKATIAAQIAAQRILDGGPIARIPVSGSDADDEKEMDVEYNEMEETSDPPDGSEAPMPPHLQRLIETYKKAKNEYADLRVMESHSKQTENIRFLRDTAENLLRYLENFDKDHYLISELEDTIASSKAYAAKLAGGRKRKFERGRSESRDRGSPSPSPYRPYGYYGQTYRGRDQDSRWDRYVPPQNYGRNREVDSYRP
ncbi:unnamed protein product [Penicillium salamii]|uniref:Uncharacterized protein n=1 Tax=Penicillium salamii TaxID=1612424 RepID=A0A9W4IU73_9EURO|nr:unnamed protein product [Penicillium salamii]CAG8047303.1 unnamed protein product [Penicillium salamii]CAG8338122.1 unnamed protein product [Penicillium salamii]CAG8338134.1 unnamed protein product [Penicillium salamii]CAG8346568.1 unnamed protein product [Penicillium salamii]